MLDLTHITTKITKQDLEKCEIIEGDRLLLKTKNSNSLPEENFLYEFVYLDATGARYLSNIGIKCIGIDYLGIERNQPDHETHKELLRSGIPIIEGLRLGHVNPGKYNLYCLPIKVTGCEAAPARAILTIL